MIGISWKMIGKCLENDWKMNEFWKKLSDTDQKKILEYT